MRQDDVATLRSGAQFDLLVIGGGATGCGIAVDAAHRGLKVALVERQDFAEGTSSRSTKLLHGGVRYLEAAVRKLDRAHFKLVLEALHERGRVLVNAPHLTRRLAMITPLYSWLALPYVYAGLKLYDLLSGRHSIGGSRVISKAEALRLFPTLRADGLKAAILYYDGQFVDSRLAIALMLTARDAGATLLNHAEVIGLSQDGAGRIDGGRVRDRLTGESWPLKAKAVINATGPFADHISRMDDPGALPILRVSAGIHIVLDRRFLPSETGMLIPKTEDGRVLFILPWQGHTLVGTTDDPTPLSDHPRARAEDIAYLLAYLRRYLSVTVEESDIKSVWSGIRPLAFNPKPKFSAQLARDHVLIEAKSGLITVSGGKWTTYRLMAEQAVDHAVAIAGLPARSGCATADLKLFGAAGFHAGGETFLINRFALPPDIAQHLHHSYGDQAAHVADLVGGEGRRRLHPRHPYIVAELIHAVRDEAAIHAIDVLARRLTLAVIDRQAAADCSDAVIESLARELGWDESRRQAERDLLSLRLTDAL